MTRRFFEVQIGNWKKKICIESGAPPSPYFAQALSFLFSPSFGEGPVDLEFIEVPMFLGATLPLKKGTKQVFWHWGTRHVQRDSFQIRIDRFCKKASFSTPVLWEDIAELLESWIGLLYESERGVRLHGVGFHNMTLLACSGFGKSFLAKQYWSELIADEVLYVYQDKIENLSSAVRTKGPGPWKTRHGERTVLAKKSSPTLLPPISFGNAGSFSVFWGIGLPQHAEFALGFSTCGLWIRVAWRRLHFILGHALWRRPHLDRASAQDAMEKYRSGSRRLHE